MKKQTKKILLIGVPLLLGAILVFGQIKKKGRGATQTTPPPPPPNSNNPFENYKVITVDDPLNIRRSPSTSSQIDGTIAKGAIIKARPSTTAGWFEYSQDGINRTGFVSGQYLQKV